jgi:hypothetical protein
VLSAERIYRLADRGPRAVRGIKCEYDVPIGASCLSLHGNPDGFNDRADFG